jgi:adenylylsulfate kinase
MTTVERKVNRAFAIWITGLPASGKSTLTVALNTEFSNRGVDVVVLESDVLRRILTPCPRYDEEERRLFYHQMTWIGTLLTTHGVPVIFDATANHRGYREEARAGIAQFLEVYVATPLEVCISRDPKGIYRRGREDAFASVPGIQAIYEAPLNPDVVIHGDREVPASAAQRIIAKLLEKGFLSPEEAQREETGRGDHDQRSRLPMQ